MTQRKHKSRQGKSTGLILLVLAGLGLVIAILLRGADLALLNPKGPIAGGQMRLVVFSVALMLSLAIPVLTLFYVFAWKYRESNPKATYNPHVRHSKFFVLSLWAIPSVLVLILASAMWPATHKLEPHKPIDSSATPLTIQVVALRWKWLFIYPQQKIATVNFVQIPTDTPVQFQLTADEAPMSSFWIPHLGGQLYAMTGHVNRLNLMADTPGDYPGMSAEINGAGFAGMKFITRASSRQAFDTWAQATRQSPQALDSNAYKELLKPSQNNPATFYTTPQADLYDTVHMKYRGSNDHHMEQE